MVSFDNTEIAFLSKKNWELRKSKFLFFVLGSPFLVTIGKVLLTTLFKIKLPLIWAYKPTFYWQFVGGETIEECEKVIRTLADQNVKSILDYPVELGRSLSSQEKAFQEIFKTINYTSNHPFLVFTVFKPSGLIDISILRKVSKGEILENSEEIESFDLFKKRVDMLCNAAYEANKPILVDAELSWNQKAIDQIAEEMMMKYNKEKAIVFNTIQLYRVDRLDYFLKAHRRAVESGYFYGAKLVRGAYMEIERLHAEKTHTASPIHENKLDTDRDFNEALKYSIMNIETISIFCGTHNEDSVNYLTCLMDSHGVSINDPRIYFSQLYGMSDNISFNLAESNYNIAKYIPYGPINQVIPYLIRRAEENTSVQGQTSRELLLIKYELKRRRKKKPEQN